MSSPTLTRRAALGRIGAGLGAALGAGALGLGCARAEAPRRAGGATREVGVFYSPDYVVAAHGFETTRKAAWVATSLDARKIPGVTLRAPRPVTEDELLRVHTPEYVAAVRTGTPRALAESQGFRWDPGLWTAARASTGGAVLAALDALATGGASGSLSSGLHHARADRGAGFCTFNGLALAALLAHDAGAQRVLILDLDAHCGGGTHALVGEHPAVRHVDISVSRFDDYTPTGANTLELVSRARDYLPTVARRLAALAPSGEGGPPFDLCLYNAGVDVHEGSPIGGLAGVDAAIVARREALVFDWCRAHAVPVAFVLAGGYLGLKLDRADLVDLHRLTLTAATST